MARAALGLSLRDLAQMAKVHRNTICNFETGKYASEETSLTRIRVALERAGVEFLEEEGGLGVRIKAPMVSKAGRLKWPN
jgi:transcriptional regulator with XRE-family HTH domain